MKNIFTLLFLVCSLSIFAQDGKLGKAKAGLSSSSSSSSSSKSSNNDDESDDDGEINAMMVEAFAQVFYYVGIKSLFGNVERTDLNIYPYYQGYPGEYITEQNDYVEGWEEELGTSYSYAYKKSDLKAQLNYFSAYGVNGFQANIDFRMLYFLGLNASYSGFYENNLGNTNQLDVASLMLNFYRIRTKYVTMWWGIGATRVGGGVDTAGVGYNLGMNIFPVRPLSLYMLWKQSAINQSSVDEFRLQAKYHLKRSSVFIGWHYNEIGGVNLGGVGFGLEYIIN
ncbi:hypothetical protein SAMN05216480_103250 [Pustulibacterium marinum]|uniref:MetA-pathway of phenol degradation n=1 Tax=Pustulibacterium marinum TaxID=1224947 RepID=A0A1I7G751_9FLAO|nr:hypothetical protein [Pustulibacterium marinum]SFU44181.1 hypothetical protein SAMN05216480_103250 [Pustulibacterium marinum]